MYTTVQGVTRHDQVVKGSEFIALVAPVPSVRAALEWLAGIRAERADATHVCWAYRVNDQYRFSDDGEPGGTAGAPIYRALEATGLDFVVVAVVRYYGGVNLGAGGLVRAYGGTAAEALRLAPRLEVHPRVRVQVRVGFEHTNALYRLLESFDTPDREDSFTDQGLQVAFNALETKVETLRLAVRDATRGQGLVTLA